MRTDTAKGAGKTQQDPPRATTTYVAQLCLSCLWWLLCLACLVCVVCLVCMLRLLCLARLACLDSLLCLLCLAWVRTCVRTYARMPVAISSMGSRLRGIRPPAQHMEASSPVTSGGTSGVPRARGAPAQTCSTLEKFPGKQPWTNIQTQKGSCRSMDTVEASDWMPPEAKDSCEIEYVSLSKTHFAHGCKLGVWPQNRGTSSCSGLHVHEAAAGDPTAVPERP